MNIIKPYYSTNSSSRATIYLQLCFVLLVLFSFFNPLYAKEISTFKDKELNPIVSFDEVPVEFIVDGYFRFETDVILTDSNLVYINIEDLFKNLGIYCKAENNGTYLTGFIEKETKTYAIDFNSKQITVGNNTIRSGNGIVKEVGAIYIEASIIAEAFGLSTVFNNRSLSIKLESNFELPLVKQMRLEQMRKNISKLQGKEIKVDTIFKRDYHLFKFGVLDWSVASFQTQNEKSNNRIILGVGTELLHGQASVGVNYNDQYKIDNRNFNYNWRWVDDDKKYIKQAQVGKIFNQSISFLGAPLVGASINNTPNTVRKAGGYHIINEYTEPNWTVELYINDVLVNYTIADASGLYVFKVPIVYGYTTLKLKFYGPQGEERIEERTMNVPFTFVPTNTLEYSISGGMLEDNQNSKYGRGVANYGLNRFMTIGGGLEYLSSIPNKPYIPFATLALQPFSKMVLNFEYAYDVRMRALLNYNFGKSAFLEVDYANFEDGQLATRFNANEERKVRLTIPYKWSKLSGYTKLNYNQYVYNAFNYNQFDATFSGYYKNYNANVSTLLNWVGDKPAFMTTNLSMSYRMSNGLIFRPSAEYNVSADQLLRYRAELEKRVAKMYFSASYERNVMSKTDNVFLTFSYDLNFARTGFSAAYNNNRLNFSENAQGSLAFGADNGVFTTSVNSAIGKGGILFYPFLDLNQNGKKDRNEPMVLVKNARVSGAKAVISAKDSIVRVSDLNAFINYNVEFSDVDLDNISWRFKHKTYQVQVDPHQYKKVAVPIIVMGEVSGIVALQSRSGNAGQGRVTIQIFDKKDKKVAETQSENDGYYSYLGLKPGDYSIRIDGDQLKKIGYQSMPKAHAVEIKIAEDGVVLQGLDFEISAATESTNSSTEVVVPTISKTEIISDKVDAKKAPKEILKGEKAQQNEKKSGNGSLDILKRYSTETNGKMYGKVHSKVAGRTNGISGVKVQLYNLQKLKVGEVATNDNGGYSFSDLIPGDYSIRLDENELEKLGYQSKTKLHNVVVLTAVAGDIIDNLDFEIILIDKNNKESVNQTDVKNNKPITSPENAAHGKGGGINTSNIILDKKNILEEKINKAFSPISNEKGSFYSIQIGVFENVVNPKQLLNLSPVYYEILSSDKTRYLAGKFDLLSAAKEAKNKIVSSGIEDAYVVAYQDGTKIERTKLDKLKKNPRSENRNIHGLVQLKNNDTIRGIAGISVQIWNLDGVKLTEVDTNDEGVFIFTGIKSGKYIVRLNEKQLGQLGCQSTPKIYTINSATPLETADFQSLDFVLNKIR